MGGKAEDRVPQNEAAIITALRVGRDEFVNNIRWSCITEQEAQRQRKETEEFLEKGLIVSNTTMAEVCQFAVAEAARRGIFDGLYERFYPANPRAAYEHIVQQAWNNKGDTEIPITHGTNQGKTHGLSCALAFEAGYRFGTENPDKDPAPTVDMETIRAAVPECLREGSTVSSRDGLVVGTKVAQDRGDDDVTLLDVPDVREGQAIERR